MKRSNESSAGFTLVELMVVVGIIGIIAATAIPAYASYRDKAYGGRIAAELRNLQTAFMAYEAVYGEYPTDSHANLPPGMEEFISPSRWPMDTPLGGWYNWEGPDSYPYAGISLYGTTGTPEQLETVDSVVDDGNLTQGRFRQTSNGRYTYIIEE